MGAVDLLLTRRDKCLQVKTRVVEGGEGSVGLHRPRRAEQELLLNQSEARTVRRKTETASADDADDDLLLVRALISVSFEPVSSDYQFRLRRKRRKS